MHGYNKMINSFFYDDKKLPIDINNEKNDDNANYVNKDEKIAPQTLENNSYDVSIDKSHESTCVINKSYSEYFEAHENLKIDKIDLKGINKNSNNVEDDNFKNKSINPQLGENNSDEDLSNESITNETELGDEKNIYDNNIAIDTEENEKDNINLSEENKNDENAVKFETVDNETTRVNSEKILENKDLKNVFSVFKLGNNKIQSIKALCQDYKNNLNKRFREKIRKLNSFIYYNNDNNFLDKHIKIGYINDIDKMDALKNERISRLFLYIDDINKLQQTLKDKQNDDSKLLEDDKNEQFYDSNENIEDFFIFDRAFSNINNDVDSMFTECANSSVFRDDASIDNLLDEGIGRSNEECNIYNLFSNFSFKNYYMLYINKNLCSIYDCTPMIIKKFAQKINSYNTMRKSNDNIKSDKHNNNDNAENISLPPEFKDNPNYYYGNFAYGQNENFDAYIQFHCEKWQENIYDTVEVNSLELNFDRLRCNIM
ncbi:conserved Plasmodium protein, unknown function [Plasmodium berghei]|uniref:Uncharacterized protein n=2 Tax=Plasmodium berghei TaxID=5821 RepID=A0A509APZ4_PLABA|nr:conserved Plasmodium protein, unknown function [Plasmodium berghei ANKA]CXJ12637.1 conserved Plasmodium protein, unknown function [Plasmodium berghei]SCM26088.1 conserved Plasmodium protein, unknown function [Plasmodium berghei]SCN28271.1 conserved Plasmodium protein, unknown function [Plasmodium berghei]SCO62469.1 conserved Plasmodium protein, unknown function [Plasmodium berghei]SCO64027.1 conserved Plasmodium protein, unknown function [Plasmodium berghei]|eukprot:XP_034423923.1 conserved Plasmodium protein, unknown function [Plasmodium berghei ANKA]